MNSDFGMSEFLIPDLFKIVLEYSEYADRQQWNFPEDTNPIHEELTLAENNVNDIARMTKMSINNWVFISDISFPLLQSLQIWSGKYIPNMSTYPNLTYLLVGYYTNNTIDLTHNTKLHTIEMGIYCNVLVIFPKVSSLKSLLLPPNVRGYEFDLTDQHKLENLDCRNVTCSLDLTNCPLLTNVHLGDYDKQLLKLTPSQLKNITWGPLDID